MSLITHPDYEADKKNQFYSAIDNYIFVLCYTVC